MTDATVLSIKQFLEEVPKVPKRLSIVWHGGEPLSAGIDFYSSAFEVFTRDSFECGIRHNIQTNATLIDEQWCTLFKRYDVSVGVSIDGPKHIHDARRKTRSGDGTFDKVMKAIDLLNSHGISFSTISVITPQMLRDSEEAVNFFGSIGSKFLGFNVEEAEGVHAISELDSSIDRAAVVAFFERLAALEQSRPEIKVRELDQMRKSFRSPPGSEMLRSTNQPGSILSFDVCGNVSTFSPELLGASDQGYGGFTWGNAHRDSWVDVLANPAFQRVRDAVDRGVRKCRDSCGYFPICGGGDPSNKLAERGRFDVTETDSCRLHVQAVADVVMAELES